MTENTCAVVVTYNRKALLRECLGALLAQTRPLAGIIVVNNCSTDGTAQMLAEEFPPELHPAIQVLHAKENRGGAGGFHDGLKAAAEQGFDWFWLLDDDVIVRLDALELLFVAHHRFADEPRPVVLASKITLPTGTLDPATTPWVKRNDMEQMCRAAEHGTIALRVNAFVAVLLHRSLVARYGLPIASYFIWLDDVEYTGRILRTEFGVLVPQSVVVHKTITAKRDPGPRFYYAVRNQLWMIRHSSAWSQSERYRLLGSLLLSIVQRAFAPPLQWMNLKVIFRGLVDGLFRSPD